MTLDSGAVNHHSTPARLASQSMVLRAKSQKNGAMNATTAAPKNFSIARSLPACAEFLQP